MERMLFAVLALIAAGLAAAFFLYVSVLPILVIAAAVVCAVCAAGLALASGHLPQWVEIEDASPRQTR